MTEEEKIFAELSEACAKENLKIVMNQINRGQIPDRKDVILVLRGDKNIPRKLRDHLIEFLEGRIKARKGRGRPSLKEKNEYAYELRKFAIRMLEIEVDKEYQNLKENFPNHGDKKNTAFRNVAARRLLGIEPRFKIDTFIYSDREVDREDEVEKCCEKFKNLIYPAKRSRKPK